jgi:hypothetical protein
VGRDAEPAAGRVAGERDVFRGEPLIEQPAVRGGRVVELRREGVLRREPVMREQCPYAGRLGEVADQLPVRVERAANEAAADDVT